MMLYTPIIVHIRLEHIKVLLNKQLDIVLREQVVQKQFLKENKEHA